MNNIDWIGFIGVFLILIAYFLNVLQKLQNNSLPFILLNLFGGVDTLGLWGMDVRAMRESDNLVNIPLNYDGASKPRLSGKLEMNQYDGRIDDIINELANDYSSVSNNQLLQIFYYFNVPKSSSYEYQLYFNDDYVSSDINDVIRYGVFSLARELIQVGYERRDDGEA